MSILSRSSLTFLVARVTSAIAGVSKNLTAVPQIPLVGVTYTTVTLVVFLQSYVDKVTALKAAHNQLHAASQEEREQRKQVVLVLRALAGFVINLFGSDPNKVGDFGFAVPRRRVETPATRAAAVAKATATKRAKKAALDALKSPAAQEPTAGDTTTKS